MHIYKKPRPRPNEQQYIISTYRIPKDLHIAIKQYCFDNDISFNNYILEVAEQDLVNKNYLKVIEE